MLWCVRAGSISKSVYGTTTSQTEWETFAGTGTHMAPDVNTLSLLIRCLIVNLRLSVCSSHFQAACISYGVLYCSDNQYIAKQYVPYIWYCFIRYWLSIDYKTPCAFLAELSKNDAQYNPSRNVFLWMESCFCLSCPPEMAFPWIGYNHNYILPQLYSDALSSIFSISPLCRSYAL